VFTPLDPDFIAGCKVGRRSVERAQAESASSSLRQKRRLPQAAQKLRPAKVAISPLWEKA